MPMGYMGFSLSRMADSRADRVDASATAIVEPLPPGVDPLEALDPETRELVTSLEPATDPDAEDGVTLGDRIESALVWGGLGAFAGALAANWTPRHQRWNNAGPMNVAATLTFAGIGAAIGGVAGFARGGDPIERDTRTQVQSVVGARTGASLATVSPGASHPAFASLQAG